MYSRPSQLELKEAINEVKYRCLLLHYGSVHQGHERVSDDFRGRQEILCV